MLLPCPCGLFSLSNFSFFFRKTREKIKIFCHSSLLCSWHKSILLMPCGVFHWKTIFIILAVSSTNGEGLVWGLCRKKRRRTWAGKWYFIIYSENNEKIFAKITQTKGNCFAGFVWKLRDLRHAWKLEKLSSDRSTSLDWYQLENARHITPSHLPTQDLLTEKCSKKLPKNLVSAFRGKKLFACGE